MHDMVEEVARPIVRGELRHNKSPWRVVMNNMRAKGRGEHVVQSFADGASGWLVWRVSSNLSYRLVWEDVLHNGCDQGVRVRFPGCGLSLTRIASDN